jgi:ketosteroid isomerase-like protein
MGKHHDTVRSLYDALASGDVPTVLAALALDIRWTEAEGFPYGGTYLGADSVLNNVLIKLGTEWDGFAAVPQELIGDGDTVIVLGDHSGQYKATGRSFKAPFVHVWRFEGPKIASFMQHTDTEVVQRAIR